MLPPFTSRFHQSRRNQGRTRKKGKLFSPELFVFSPSALSPGARSASFLASRSFTASFLGTGRNQMRGGRGWDRRGLIFETLSSRGASFRIPEPPGNGIRKEELVPIRANSIESKKDFLG
ncbi:hypothetical protein CDAR_116671 [Caerostris darwini]|uniref:Uncharacterized protein n=1 Tax=Caerostris darwini TaxID=1538125 RepID=A0AAV4R3W3_9ARAC|nr:hypothetical protein CDAR_116671 [Caerostris darwini]